jgi:phosphatidylethanolamine/phosphatidyl-N-methylethanolamine N-methyltransferase
VLFLRKFLRHGTRVASVTPSSRFMARQLAREVDPTRVQTIIELGAGTGAVTREIVRRSNARSRVIAFEFDADFASFLQRDVGGRVEVVAGDVGALDHHLDTRGVNAIDVVVSGLPTPSLPAGVLDGMMSALHTRASSASYSQLTEFLLPVYRGLYRRLFEQVRYVPVPLNFPPGGAYHCRGPKRPASTRVASSDQAAEQAAEQIAEQAAKHFRA